ncbi:polyhydroxyalkanoate biosynthesis repressor PhaR [Neobacillus sp. WH10]|uniref:polyhydroxyalkanoate biosynthesis repressor PhaR n=1 Tax=Neobacillus sp. WH10 TaxID=3047873 RepID=UPI0024C11391|nr:polyhydroxyalkanoate biosynthesis repressor PhaR [Neobacillus sp. WH10]WHY79097.1 polyhydroxyalkanoate biosynthesis repressor PhaR [Neobacillus sp. WH10]
MTKDKNDPFEGFKLIGEMWEKQLNGLLYMMTDNNEFVQLLKVGTESHARYIELLRKNQELMAGVMNIPTKKDVANVAKLSVQTEEKIDILEEQIWNLQDSIGLLNKENLEMFQEVVSVVKQMKRELQKMALEITETKKIQAELKELRQGLVDIKIIQINLQELRKEMEEIKGIKTELKGVNDAADTTAIQKDLQELMQEVTKLTDIKAEIATLKKLFQKGKVKDKEKEKELVLTGAGTTKS